MTKKTKFGIITTLLTASCAVGVCATALAQNSAAAETTIATATTTEALTFESGASIRMSDPTGIRFTAKLDESLKDSVYTVTDNVVDLAEGAELGMIIVPAQALAGVGNYDVFEYLETTYGKTKAQVSTQFNATEDGGKIVRNEENTAYIVKGAIVDIQDVNFNYDYQAVAYYKLANGSYVYSASKSSVRTISYVADAALRNKSWGTPQKDVLTNIVKKSYTLKNGTEYTAKLTIGGTLDLTTVLPATENAENYAFALTSGENVTLENGTLTAVSAGNAVVTAYINAYNDTKIEIAKIPVEVTAEKKTAETEVSEGLNLAEAIGENVASATLNGEPVTVTDGKVSLDKEDAGVGAAAKVYNVVGASGKAYEVTADIWSLIIDNKAELLAANTYTWNEEYVADEAQGTKNYKVYGYFKLGADIDMSGETWALSNRIANEVSTTYATGGFLGVFDGDGYTISNITMGTDTGTALIGYTGESAVVKNLTMKGVTVKSYHNSAALVNTACGGTFENITVEVTAIPKGYAISDSAGALFANVYIYGSTVSLKNVRVVNKGSEDYGTGTYDCATALGHIASNDKTKLELNGVTVIGFGDYIYSVAELCYVGANVSISRDKATVTQNDGIANYATVTGDGVAIYATKADYDEYIDSITVKLQAQEIELNAEADYTATVDFTTLISEEISQVTVDGVALQGTSKTFAKEEASNVAKVCLLETTDGKLYSVNVTVWSMLIASSDEFIQMNSYGYTVDGKAYGYYKVTEGFNMTGVTWNKTYQLGYGTTKNNSTSGFVGVFDGGNKTITGFTISAGDCGLVYALNNGGVIKNVIFDDAKFSGTGIYAGARGIIAYSASGGLIENVTINLATLPKGTNITSAPAVVFGVLYNRNTLTLRNVTVVNKDDGIATYGSAAGQLCTALGRMNTSTATLLVLDGVTVTNFGDYVMADGNYIVGATSKFTLATTSDALSEKTVTENDGVAKHVTIGDGGVTIDGTKITA